MLELDHVGFSYGKRLILDNASALFEEGSTTAIMGPSGSGKTTLLRLMDGSLQPDTGSVTIDGANVNSIDRKNLLGSLCMRIFQDYRLIPYLNVRENIMLAFEAAHKNLGQTKIKETSRAENNTIDNLLEASAFSRLCKPFGWPIVRRRAATCGHRTRDRHETTCDSRG